MSNVSNDILDTGTCQVWRLQVIQVIRASRMRVQDFRVRLFSLTVKVKILFLCFSFSFIITDFSCKTLEMNRMKRKEQWRIIVQYDQDWKKRERGKRVLWFPMDLLRMLCFRSLSSLFFFFPFFFSFFFFSLCRNRVIRLGSKMKFFILVTLSTLFSPNGWWWCSSLSLWSWRLHAIGIQEKGENETHSFIAS